MVIEDLGPRIPDSFLVFGKTPAYFDDEGGGLLEGERQVA
jgi:hypothetical protein